MIDLRTIDRWDPFIYHAIVAKTDSVEEYYTRLGNPESGGDAQLSSTRFSKKPTAIQAVLQKRFIEEADKWPYPHPSELFDTNRGSLQRQLNELLGITLASRREDWMSRGVEFPNINTWEENSRIGGEDQDWSVGF